MVKNFSTFYKLHCSIEVFLSSHLIESARACVLQAFLLCSKLSMDLSSTYLNIQQRQRSFLIPWIHLISPPISLRIAGDQYLWSGQWISEAGHSVTTFSPSEDIDCTTQNV